MTGTRINVHGKEVSRKAFKRSFSKGSPFIEGDNREARRKAERLAKKMEKNNAKV